MGEGDWGGGKGGRGRGRGRGREHSLYHLPPPEKRTCSQDINLYAHTMMNSSSMETSLSFV